MAATQDNRILRITTPLKQDFLLINSFEAREAISELFTVTAELLHEENEEGITPTEVDIQQILGKPVNIQVSLTDGTKRHFDGIVNRFSQKNRDPRFTYYEMSIVPAVWVLTQTRRSRIFQQKSVKDILAEIFQGFDVKDETQANYEPRNYCVQYRESDFDFASRLMEEEGIFYYFLHTADSHRMIIADDPGSHRDCPGAAEIEFVAKVEGEDFQAAIHEWHTDYQLQAGTVTFWDHNFQLPTNKLEVIQPSRFNIGGNQALEIYDYPGSYAENFDGIEPGGSENAGELGKISADKQRSAEALMGAIDVRHKLARGSGTVAAMTAGHRFKLKEHGIAANNAQYIISEINHSAEQSPDYVSDLDVADAYRNSFVCMPHGAGAPPFKPERRTKKPVVLGSQSAVVVGPAGEEIFTDKYGRVKVNFHWDREGQPQDGNTSCWVRVGRDLAGKKWGTMHIPRVGQEVIVDFMEGDPDKPVVVGSVYNPETMPHYELPKYKTLTYIKTRTSPDDGKGFNELRFEDKKGKEQVFVHSQKRYDLRVRGSMYETCGGNRHEVIGMRSDNQPGGNLAMSIGGNHDLHIKGDQYIGVDTDLFEGVKGNVTEGYKGSQSTVVTSNAELNAKAITLEALTGITLKVGGSFIKVDLTGITIQGPMVKINSGGAATGTGPALLGAPLDAETADTGEPGYLDRPRRGGGGGGRRWEVLTGQHAPENIVRNDDGTYQMGSIVVQGDEAYQQAVLSDLATMSNTNEGQQLIDDLNNSGQTTTIRPLTPAPNPPNAFAQPGTGTYADYQNATPAGQPVFDGAGNPLNDSSGNQLVGTGTGGPADIQYNPGDWPSPTSQSQAPGDVILFHEMQHANNQQRGQYDGTPRNDGFDTNEEFNAIGPENRYRDERDVPRRTDHHDL